MYNKIINLIRTNYTILFATIIIIVGISKLFISYYLQDTAFNRGNSHSAIISLAKNIANHNTFSIEYPTFSIDYEPLYPFLIGMSFKLFGDNWFAIALLNTILISIATYLFYLTSRVILKKLIAVVTSIYFLLYPYYFLYSLSVQDTNLFLMLLLSLLYLLISYSKNQSFATFAEIGIIIGLLMLTRGSIIAILPAVLIFISYNEIIIAKNYKRLIKNISIIVLFAVITISPWIVRNYMLTEKIIISTHGPFGLWQGNNELSYHFLTNDISLDQIYLSSPHPEIIKKYPPIPREPKATIKVANAYQREALTFIKNKPKEFLSLAYVKFHKFWSPIRTPIGKNFLYGTNNLRQYIYFISYFPLLILFPIGIILLYKQKKGIFILFLGILFFYTLAHMIVMGFTRARIPLDTILILSTGFLLRHFHQYFNRNEI